MTLTGNPALQEEWKTAGQDLAIFVFRVNTFHLSFYSEINEKKDAYWGEYG